MGTQTVHKLLIVDTAALSQEWEWGDLTFRAVETVFPALTCTVQASFRTASAPASHGMVSNGVYLRQLARPMFWEQPANLVAGKRIWHDLRACGGKVAMLFWQQSMGEEADIVLTPAPIHKHHGGMIMDCSDRPAGLYDRLCRQIGKPFNLRHYWGPMARPAVGNWIIDATLAVLREESLAPDLCLTYLPTLDYDLQRHDPTGPRARAALNVLERQLARLLNAAREMGYEVLVFGDYAIRPVTGAVFPNRALAEAGLFKTRSVRDMLYPDLPGSRAFAMVDHQIAHVYVADRGDIEPTRDALSRLPGVEELMDRPRRRDFGIDHANSGELVAVAAADRWFAYPWWHEKRQAPDYAGHVDIHNKPGYDPCELRWGWPPGSVSRDTSRIRGSHGRAGSANTVTWAASIDLGGVRSLLELSAATREWLNEG